MNAYVTLHMTMDATSRGIRLDSSPMFDDIVLFFVVATRDGGRSCTITKKLLD